MNVRWTSKALADVTRLYEFLALANPAAAARTAQELVGAAGRISERPRIGEKLDTYEPREVRRLLVGRYELRYEIRENTIYVLRLWHTREDR